MSAPCTACGKPLNYPVPVPQSPQPGGTVPADPEPPAISDCPVHYVEVEEAFNFPAPGETAVVRTCCAEGLSEGAVLYSLGIGYLHVEAVLNECEIEVSNYGEDCNLQSGGEPVAEGAKLLVGIPPCTHDHTNEGACLTTDFFVPEICPDPESNGGCCVDVGVTGVEGLVVGDRLAYGSREFRLSEIKNPNLIRICNDGNGGLPGAVVQIGDCFIVVGGQNICGRDAVDGGQILVCRNGVMRPVVGEYDGQLLQWDSSLQRFKLVAAPPLPSCTSLDSEFTVVATNPSNTTYIIDVFDSSQFIAGALIYINESGGQQRKFVITSIPDATHLAVQISFTPGANITFLPGAAVCIIDDACNATPVTMPEGGGYLLSCIAGATAPVYPSLNNEILVGLNTGWQKFQRPHGFVPVLSQIYSGLTTLVAYPVNTTIPDQIGTLQRWAVLEIYVNLDADGANSTITAYINGSPIVAIDGSEISNQTASLFRYYLVPVTDGDNISMQALTTGPIDGATCTIMLMGYLV